MSKTKAQKRLSDKIVKIFKNFPYSGFTAKEIQKKLANKKFFRKDIKKSLFNLLQKGKIYQKKDGRFFNQAVIEEIDGIATTKSNLVEGTVDLTSRGAAYIVTDEYDDDIYISRNNVNRAFDGDIVKVLLKDKKSGKLEGEIVEIVKRRQEEFSGVIDMQENFAFCRLEKSKVPVDFYIKHKNLNGAKQNDKVIVKMIGWPKDQKSPYGDVKLVLGQQGEHQAEMKSIIIDNGFALKFPKKVKAFAEALSVEIPQEVIDERLDCRGIPTFTIDPHDAKDFDDALSLRLLDNGNWEVGVHIADVSHYVQPDTPEDIEAMKRATSVYLVDRVIPMFPEELSNEVCSLRPNEDKLCFSAIFELDKNAEVLNKQFARTVIHSNRRFTYEEAQVIIEGEEGDFKNEILKMYELSTEIRARRMAKGAIRFDRPEVKFKLDKKGKPIGVFLKIQKEANMMIEDFMLLANESVATYFSSYIQNNKKAPGVYRTHAAPEMEKLENFRLMAARFGHKLNFTTPKNISKSINNILGKVQGKPEESLIETLAVRSMQKAEYTTENIGHYGLAFEHYTHFTSPIRRYPDIMVHRILQRMLDNDADFDKINMEKIASYASGQERNAMKAERESVKFKQVEYLSERLGEEYEGVISGVQSYGFFVELSENYCEGLVRVESLTNDKFIYIEEEFALVGHRTAKKYRLGSKVKVVVVSADLKTRTVDFELAE